MFTKLSMPSILLGSGDTTLREIELLEASEKGEWQRTNTPGTSSALKERERGEKLTKGGGSQSQPVWGVTVKFRSQQEQGQPWKVAGVNTPETCTVKQNWEKSQLLRRKKNPVSLGKRSGRWNQDLGASSRCLSFIVMIVRSPGVFNRVTGRARCGLGWEERAVEDKKAGSG